MDARYVIHTVGPVWKNGSHREEQILSSCYRNSLTLAKEHECESIAFPLIATGNYGFPKPLALQIAVREISTFLLENEMQVYLVVFGKEAFALSEKLFKSVSSYIDENYIRSKTLDEYGTESMYGSRLETRRIREQECSDMSVGAAIPIDSDDWGQLLKDLDAGFSETLLQLIDRTGKKDSEIYKKANVDRKLFSKIRNNMDYRPSKTTALLSPLHWNWMLMKQKTLLAEQGLPFRHSS